MSLVKKKTNVKKEKFSNPIIDEVDVDTVSFSHGVDNTEGGSSFLAYFNIVCVVAGTGALGLPYALKQGGWIG